MSELPSDVQLGLDIYLAFLQRVQMVGTQMLIAGHELISLTDKLCNQAKSNPNFDYERALKVLEPLSKASSAYAIQASFVSEWVQKVHALH